MNNKNNKIITKINEENKGERKFLYNYYDIDTDDDNEENDKENKNEEDIIYLKEFDKISKVLEEDLIKEKNKTYNIKKIISKMKKMKNITLRIPDEFDEEIPKENFEKIYKSKDDDKIKLPISTLK